MKMREVIYKDNETLNQYIENLIDSKNDPNDGYLENRKTFSNQLFMLFKHFEALLPEKKDIKVLSLACGVPDEFLALLTFYQEKNCNIDFTGIDIKESLTKDMTESFAHYSKNFRLLTVDGSDPNKVKERLTESKCLPDNGFDLIIFRQPDVLTAYRAKIFRDMVEKVIPFVSSKESRVFTSCFHKQELDKVFEIMSATGLYFKPGPNNYCEVNMTKVTVIDIGQKSELAPDSYSFMMECKGYAFKPKQKKSTPSLSNEDKHDEVIIHYPNQSADYVRRLRFVLGDDIVRCIPNSNLLFFPSFWIKQLEDKAIGELSKELYVDKQIFKI